MKKKLWEEKFAPNANLKRQREIVQERLRKKGIVPSISDLEAFQRVRAHGLDLFNELTDLLARELNKRLQGKISTLNVENKYLVRKLSRVQEELDAYRDQHFLSFSKDNRALKEELKGMKEKLEVANAEVVEQKKLLERLPQAEKERGEARQQASDVEAREEKLKTRVAQLTEADSEHRQRFAKASVEGFQMALNLTTVLAPRIDFKYFNGSYVGRDGKIYKGYHVAYDAIDAVYEAEDEEETESPTDAAGAVGAETRTA